MPRSRNIISKSLQIIGAMIVCQVTATEVSIVVVVIYLVGHLVTPAEQPIRHQGTSQKDLIWVTTQTFHSNVLIAKKKLFLIIIKKLIFMLLG